MNSIKKLFSILDSTDSVFDSRSIFEKEKDNTLEYVLARGRLFEKKNVQERIKELSFCGISSIETLFRITTNIIEGDLETKLSIKNEKIQTRILNFEACIVLLGYIGYDYRKDDLYCPNPNPEKVVFLHQQLKELLNVKETNIEEKQAPKEDKIELKLNLKDIEVKDKENNVKTNQNYKSFFVQDVGLLPEKQKFELPDKYQYMHVMGVGTYGIVILAWDKKKEKKVAIKKLKNIFDEEKSYQKSILNEIELLKHFKDHPNIVFLVDVIIPIKSKDIYLVFEYLEGDMELLLKHAKVDKDDIKWFMYNLLCGLFTLHSSNVVHRDLKPSNVLINLENDIRICDFGLSRSFNPELDQFSNFYVASRWYRSPELIMGYEKCGKPMDLWSVGCIFAEMLQNDSRMPIFPGDTSLSQLELILDAVGKQAKSDIKGQQACIDYVLEYEFKEKAQWNYHPYLRHVDDKDALDLLDKLLQFNPEKRITCEAGLRHSYFKDLFDEKDLIKFPLFSSKNLTFEKLKEMASGK